MPNRPSTAFHPSRRTALLGAIAATLAPAPRVFAQALPKLTVATLKFGTVNWELDTIRRYELDKKHGFELDVLGMASGSASKIAFEGGQADALVSDWLWVARQRASGRDFTLAPYSSSVGSMIVPEGSDAKTLADLKGKRVGIAGGPLDKNWLIMQGFAKSQGFDLKGETEQVFGAPPLLSQQALEGGVDALLTFWHFEAKLRANGFRRLVTAHDASQALGLPPEIPLLGYVFRESLLTEKPAAITGLLAASKDAKDILASDDAAWEALRGRMKPKSEAEFLSLKEGFLAGIPQSDMDSAGAEKLFETLAELGGEKLVGDTKTLPAGVFFSGGS